MLSGEAKKFNPANLEPYWFLRSPTAEAGGAEVKYLAGQLSKTLETQGHFYPDRSRKRTLRLGAELEVIFFSPEADPDEADRLDDSHNPNYADKHLTKVKRILSAGELFAAKNSRHFYMKEPVSQEGRIMLEYRTPPQSLEAYDESIKVIRDHIVVMSTLHGVLPVVYSQHLHISLLAKKSNPIDAVENSGSRSKFHNNINEVFNNSLPFLQLPEEYESDNRAGWSSGGWNKVPEHYQFRLLSSEYAADPLLNALISLRALYAGLAEDYLPDAPKHHSFESDADSMSSRQTLRDLLGQSLLSTLSGVVKQYPKVSARSLTVPQLIASNGLSA